MEIKEFPEEIPSANNSSANQNFIEQFRKFFKNSDNRIVIVASTIAIIVVSAVLTNILYNRTSSNKEVVEAQRINENPAQKNDILAQVIKNNSTSLISNSESLEDAIHNNEEEDLPDNEHPNNDAQVNPRGGYVQIDPSTGLPLQLLDSTQGFGMAGIDNPTSISADEVPDLTQYNYRQTSVTTTPGPAKGECAIYKYIDDEVSEESIYEYFENNRYYYKRTNLEEETGDLIGYYMSVYGNDINENYTFANGNYGVLTKYDVYGNYQVEENRFNVSYPISYMPGESTENTVRRNFGDTTQFLRVIQREGKVYYEIQREYTLDCNAVYGCGGPMFQIAAGESKNINLISILLIDSENFQVVEQDQYLDEAIPENLIYTQTTTVERRQVDTESARAEFTFNYNVDLRIVDYRNYNYSQSELGERIVTFLENNTLDILMPEDVNLSYLYAKNLPSALQDQDYYRDREYYANNERGQRQYQVIQDAYGPLNPYLSTSYTTIDGDYIYVNHFENEANIDDLIQNAKSHSSGTIVETTRDITVDGNNISARVIEVSYSSTPSSYPLSYVASYPVSFPESSSVVYYNIFFEYNNVKYEITTRSNNIERILNTNNNVITTANRDELNDFEIRVRNAYMY